MENSRKVERVRLMEWDGTVERFNEIVSKCFPRYFYYLEFLDDNFNWTNLITKNFRVGFTPNIWPKDEKRTTEEYNIYKSRYEGMIFKAPCSIIVDITEEKSSLS